MKYLDSGMKALRLAIFLIGFFPCASSVAAQGGGGDTLRVVFTPDHTKEDLIRIKQEVSVMGIKLDYWELKFDDAGKLSVIRFHVADRAGKSGSAGTDDLVKNAPFGFRIDGSRKARRPVTIGCLK